MFGALLKWWIFESKLPIQSPLSFEFSIKLNVKSNWTLTSRKVIINAKFIERGRSGSYPFTEKLLLVLFSFIRPGERRRSASQALPPLEHTPFEPYRKIDAKCDKWKTLFIVGPRARYVMGRLLSSRSRPPFCPRPLGSSYQVFLYPSYRSILRTLYKRKLSFCTPLTIKFDS